MLPHPGKPRFVNAHVTATNGYWTKMNPRSQNVSVAESQHYVVHATNPGGALDDSVEHRLHVGRRAADDAQHLRCRCLMLQGFAQFCIALLNLLEQPHILDGDHSLVGESFKKSDLLVRERPDLCSADHNGPDWNAFSKQWCDKNRPGT